MIYLEIYESLQSVTDNLDLITAELNESKR